MGYLLGALILVWLLTLPTNNRLKKIVKLVRVKHSSLLGPFVSYEENEVL